MASSIFTDPQTGELVVRFPFDAAVVAALKMLPTRERRWDPEARCWRVDPWHRDTVEKILADAGMSPPPRQTPAADLAGALAAVFAALPAPLRASTWRALVHTWHPDHGGDAEATRALLTIRERV